jgi:predicted nuclease with TOPRIM domain
MKAEHFKTVLIVFLGIILTVMIVATFSTSGENKRLKTSINENRQKIKELENEKIAIFESIEKKSELINQKDSIILELKKSEGTLIDNLKQLKNERIKLKTAYFNNNVNERIRIFSKLASDTD